VETSSARDVRGHIVRTTLDRIGEHGLGGLTNRRIAQAAGVSLGTLTYHFPSQGDLLGTALRTFVDDEIERLAAITNNLEQRTLTSADAARLIQHVVETAATRRRQIAQFELYLHAAREPGSSETAQRCYAAYDELATAAMTALGAKDPARAARILLAFVEGFELRRLATGDTEPELAGFVSTVFEALSWES
jgi:DNA-binding transcriptional regulator YbjK